MKRIAEAARETAERVVRVVVAEQVASARTCVSVQKTVSIRCRALSGSFSYGRWSVRLRRCGMTAVVPTPAVGPAVRSQQQASLRRGEQ